MPTSNAIELRNISKFFGSVVANNKISLDVKKGEILSLLGENGSGKTTLMNMLSGIYFPDEGHIYVDGKEQEPRAAIGLCGQLCENTDFWVKERELPASIAEGDLVVVENAGAYGFGMSYQYNGRLRPAEVLVNGEEATLIRTREDFDDMIRHTFVPSRLKS